MKSKKMISNKLDNTIYLASTKANKKRLDDAIKEMNKGKFKKYKLIEQ